MRQSRKIIIVTCFLMITIGPSFYLLNMLNIKLFDYFNITVNLYCGLIVGLVTALCQYSIQKNKIVNDVYKAYFDLYKTYYYSKNKTFLFHYNAFVIYKKMTVIEPKINECLDEYHGFIKKHDRLYRKLNPTIKLGDNYKAKKVIKSLFCWFNKKYFNTTIEPMISEIEEILKNINKKRFENDKVSMIKLFEYSWR